MQTFLPYADFRESARCLDRSRLGKQRVECKQILNALVNGGAWRNHPIVKMWDGYAPALAAYGRACCDEWTSRGYADTCAAAFNEFPFHITTPPWLGNEDFHESHQSNLLRKDWRYYAAFQWNVDHNLPYRWFDPARDQWFIIEPDTRHRYYLHG